MKRTLSTLAGLAVAGLITSMSVVPAGAVPPTTPDPGQLNDSAIVATFASGPNGSFAESMTDDGHGGLMVSLTTWYPDENGISGQLWTLTPGSPPAAFGPAIPLGMNAQLLGVTVAEDGSAYVAVANWAADGTPPSGVLHVTPTAVTTVMTLPQGSAPNGIALRDGLLYVSDSWGGCVWRGSATVPSAPQTPWFASPLLAPDPAAEIQIGANGIAYRAGAMYVTNWSTGLILRIVIGGRDEAGPARLFAQDPLLKEADGITFDAIGRAWVTVNINGGSLVVLEPNGRLTLATTPVGALQYPTQAIIGADGTVYVANGSFFDGTPSVVALTR